MNASGIIEEGAITFAREEEEERYRRGNYGDSDSNCILPN